MTSSMMIMGSLNGEMKKYLQKKSAYKKKASKKKSIINALKKIYIPKKKWCSSNSQHQKKGRGLEPQASRNKGAFNVRITSERKKTCEKKEC